MIDRLLSTTVFGVLLANVVLAALVAAACYFTASLLLTLLRRRLARLAPHTRTQADDALVEVLGATSHAVLALAALLVGVGLLDLPQRWSARVGQLWFLAVALQLALWANRGIDIALRRYVARHDYGLPGHASASATLMSWGLRSLLWSMVVLGMLSNLGVNITAFIASLGVGGIAVALAAQNILGDLFASIAIAVDKPFEVGDSIALGSLSGTVEQVGIKTTRLRSPGGEQIVMSNADLLKQAVSNYKRLRERRVVFTFGIAHASSADQLAQVPAIVREVVEASPRLRFDRAHFKTLGEKSFDFEVVYIVLDPDYTVFMDEQQRINLELMRQLDVHGIGLAMPTRELPVKPPSAVPA